MSDTGTTGSGAEEPDETTDDAAEDTPEETSAEGGHDTEDTSSGGDSGEEDDDASGGVRLVKGEVTSGRRSLTQRTRAGIAVGAGVVLIVAGAFGAWKILSDDSPSLADLADENRIGDIGAAVSEAWGDLESVHVRIESETDPNTNVDLSLDVDGNCEGSLGADGAIASVRSVDGTLYYRPGDLYWESLIAQAGADEASSAQIATVRETVGERWVEGGAADETSVIGELCTGGIEALSGGTYDADAFVEDGWELGSDAEIDGTDVITLSKQSATGLATFFVRAEGEPWVLRAEVGQGEAAATYTFSEQNEPVDASAPPSDEIVTTDELEDALG